jgi:DNA-3-methyladenine glycosylase II
VVDGAPAEMSVTQAGGAEAPELHVALSGVVRPDRARAVLERMLSPGLDLEPFHALASADPALAPLAERFRGVRPPRFPSLVECLVNAVALQQLSLDAGLTLLNRLAGAFGAGGFPETAALAGADPDAIHALGFSARKAATIIAVARAAGPGGGDLERLAGREDREVVETLTSIPGIGRWSAEYALLRGFGRLHVFPGDDVGARNNLARWLGLPGPLDYAGVGRAVAGWRPYAGLVYFHLLLERLAARGDLRSAT